MEQTNFAIDSVKDTLTTVDAMKAASKTLKTEFKKALKSGGGMSSLSFYFLLLLIVALGGVGYNRYRKIMKSHLL